ncbi:hypothetical protein NP233_g2752 [Leucocoprinus birnbaumii]|uniref:Uncharacterized protein n=1 Tax=Leucocoprinus birnbaumii TaxID=56174 RepID=A0AAD5YUK4_9AGAR|nr:hypothetical protein NP233_g2752 [Leucocoprinus birnbaumii]
MADQQQETALAAAPDAVDLATSNTSCRILVVSSSASQATTLIRRIQTLGGSTDVATEVESGKKDILSPDLVKIPWTIENKYYSADVHFAVHPMRGLAPYLLQNIPALIFVWASNEAYKHHIERISSDLSGHEPEVALAVRVKASLDTVPEGPADDSEAEEDNAAIDDFVSTFGFEYVNAALDSADPREERDNDEEDEFDGIPNLPRVLDALSTIMWPSMKGRDKGAKLGKGLVQRDPSLFDWDAGDGSFSSVNELVATSSSQLSVQMSRKQNEMDELARWLENDVRDGDREDPWRLAARSDAMVASPTEVNLSSVTSREKYQELAGTSEYPEFAKFDDDFTVFVSPPPAEETSGQSGRSTPVEDELEGQDGLMPPGGLISYNSLGSVSDFGGSDGGQDMTRVISDDEDTYLPTRDEILETSSKIFGKKGEPLSTSDSQASQNLSLDGRIGDKETRLDEDGEYDMAPFDLSRVFGTLQQMKEQISGMENEDERRKAAARVALGLVYGLEAENGF